MRKSFALIAFLAGAISMASGQVNVRDSAVFAPLVEGMYSVQMPGGDLADRFGWHSTVGGGLLFKTRSNWMIGGNATFIFGNQLEETDVLAPLLTSENQIVDRNGEFADVFFFQRGYSIYGRAGKLFPVVGPNPNSGIVGLLGVGFLQHKIRFLNGNGNTVPLIEGDYAKGFDRLSNGLSLSQFVGYYYLGNKRLINFFGGFEFAQSFTQSRRSINYVTLQREDQSRLDLSYGLRIGWILPLYKRTPREFYYN